MKLLLVRHGQTISNVRMILDTALPGAPLTELGEEQARVLVETLADEQVSAVYASYATRAQQTAAPLAAALSLDVQSLEGVHEIWIGDLEGRSDPEAFQIFANVVHPWTQGNLSSAMPSGENGEQVRTRFTSAVAQLRAKHEQSDSTSTVVLVSHGGIMRFGAEWLSDNVRPEVAEQGLIPNTGIVSLETTPDGGWHCLSWAGIPM